MKVYLITRYQDNDEYYSEDFEHREDPYKIFDSYEKAIDCLKSLTVTEIYDGKEDWYISDSKPMVLCDDDNDNIRVRSRYHIRIKVQPPYYESANVVFTVYEMEME